MRRSPVASAPASTPPACFHCFSPPAAAGWWPAGAPPVQDAPAVLAPPADIRPIRKWANMEAIELILAVFPAEPQAGEALDDLKQREEDGAIRLFNAAAISKDPNSRTSVREDQDLSSGRGSLFGALVGALVGLLGGPAGAVVGAAAGAATGGLVAGKTDLGFEDAFLDELKGALQPGSSALLLLVEERWSDGVAGVLELSGAKLYRHAVRKAVIEQLAGMQDE